MNVRVRYVNIKNKGGRILLLPPFLWISTKYAVFGKHDRLYLFLLLTCFLASDIMDQWLVH